MQKTNKSHKSQDISLPPPLREGLNGETLPLGEELGATPALDYGKQAVPNMHAFFLKLPSPLGTLHLESDGEALTCVLFEGEKATHPKGFTLQEAPQLPVFVAARAWLSRYFEGHDPGAPPPVRPQGTPFQQSVWQRLLTIPYGSTTTYGALAAHLAAHNASGRMSAQAVGQAVGRNPISIIIPCHRVIGANGTLTGYAGGLDKKMFLLGLEGSLKGEKAYKGEKLKR